jgi:hypothetical protein
LIPAAGGSTAKAAVVTFLTKMPGWIPALRGMAWALQQAMGLVWYYVESNPAMARWGRRTLDRLVSAWPD